MEIWKDVIGYESYYKVSNLGRIKSLDRVLDKPNVLTGGNIVRKGKILKQTELFGYMLINLCIHDKRKKFRVHRLVAEAFILNPEQKPQVNHKNGNKKDNRVYNLEWSTASENGKHSYYNGFSKTVNKKRVMCVNNKKEFSSSFEAAECVNIRFGNSKKIKVSAGKIRLCASGKRKIAYDLIWKFID
jgi:hypothetical protein